MSDHLNSQKPETTREGLTRGEFLKATTGLALLPLALGSESAAANPEKDSPRALDYSAGTNQSSNPTQVKVSIFFPKALDMPEDLDDNPFNLGSVQRTVSEDDPIAEIVREVLKNPTEAEFNLGYFPIDTRNIKLIKTQKGDEDKTLLVLLASDRPPKMWLGPRSAAIFQRSLTESLKSYLNDPEMSIEIYVKL